VAILSPHRPPSDAEIRGQRSSPDVILLVAVLALMAFGILMVYSASRDGLILAGLDENTLLTRQAIFAVVGVVALIGFSLFDYRHLQHLSMVIYGSTLFLLALVFTQAARNGARRWIFLPGFSLQPSEFAKVAVILVLAALLAPARQDGMRWKVVGIAVGFLAVPSVLIVLQPDLGTALAFGFVAIVMLFAAGTTFRQLFVLVGTAIISVTLILNLGLLEDYQEQRLRSVFALGEDAGDTDYNQLQSLTTIGSGQVFGKGLFQGALTQRAFVPEQETDFIFTAVGEQFGFVGAASVLAAYAAIMLRLVRISAASQDRFGMLVAVGVAALFAFHVFVNIGMTVAIMPVTGLPLPFMSAGGSSLLAMAVGVGICHSIWLRRPKSAMKRMR